ncbi:hypothetical protein IE81DRAFT_321662 [Ceraceosorus guamensis]|uniref:Arrestin C-terminal-like domain-containing protein n=1 Tax=Ceraceosorus guamensis TaxID=1522189 RepID=A0A316W2L1_9BASI|nr:hypothetical protein IE81DRAFT_321662 [Ceraceosorus guamensis]PWN44010.1 hypothetical protein IE81DRAFT_321662 [Ceraceosorus guamensis]
MFAPQYPQAGVSFPQPTPASPAPAPPSESGIVRRRSLSWRAEAGLPPPPSEIDNYVDISRAMYSPNAPPPEGRRPLSRSAQKTYADVEREQEAYARANGSGQAETKWHDAAPMNAVSKHPKLQLKLVLASNVFEAGGAISGHLELTCSTGQRLRLGELAVELEAFEELSSRDHAATQIFLYNRTLFQGEHLPPSNAVLPAAPVSGYWAARKGRTTFPFSFKLPTSAPSSVAFAANASLRYVIKATSQTWWNDQKTLVTAKMDAPVVERWEDEFSEAYSEPIEAVADTRLFMGGNGAVWLEAGITEQLHTAGSSVLLRCGVKNNTKRHLSGLKVAVARRLSFPVSGPPGQPAKRPSLEPQITEVIDTQSFKGPAYEFPAGEEVVVNLAVDLPRDARTIRKTRLFEIQLFLVVSAQMGNFAKDLSVEVPFYCAHAASLQRPASNNLDDLHQRPTHAHWQQQHAHHRGHSTAQRPHSSMGQHGSHQALPQRAPSRGPLPPPSPHTFGQPSAYGSPDMNALAEYGAQRGWSPAPGVMSAGPPSRPASAAPAPPVSGYAGQLVAASPHLPHAQQQYAWDPNAQGWTASTFLHGINGLLPGSTPPAPDQSFAAAAIPRSASAAPNVGAQMSAWNNFPPAHLQASQQLQQAPPHRSVSASPGPEAQMSRHAGRRVSAPAAGGSYLAPGPEARDIPPPQHHQQQVPRNIFASPSPNILHTPQASSPSPLVSSQILHGVPAPASDGHNVEGLPQDAPLAGLATIEEDNESMAGTVRSVKALAGFANLTGSGSVTRRDVDAFERMVNGDGDVAPASEREKAMMKSMGMVPEDAAIALKTAPDVHPTSDARTLSQVVEDDKSLPKPPVPSGKDTAKAAPRPRASDLFSAPSQSPKRGASPEAIAAKSSKLEPATSGRRSSQGIALNALEERLKSPAPTSPTVPQSTTLANVPRSSDSKVTSERRESGALRAAAAAAMERERAAREQSANSSAQSTQKKSAAADGVASASTTNTADAERRRREKDAALREAEVRERTRQREERERAAHLERERKLSESRAADIASKSSNALSERDRVGSNLSLDRSASSSKGVPGNVRKEVDLDEVRQLNKMAVNRVGGWLTETPASNAGSSANIAATAASAPLGACEPDPGPKTPPQSYLRDADHENAASSTTISPALRALIDNAPQRSAPKPGTAILTQSASRRFSGGLATQKADSNEKAAEGTSASALTAKPSSISARSRRTSMPAVLAAAQATRTASTSSASSRNIETASVTSYTKLAAQNDKIVASVIAPPANSTNVSGATGLAARKSMLEKNYQSDAAGSKSAAQGSAALPTSGAADRERGGRVMSVASMWASIAEGKDGSSISSVASTSTLNARPKARTSTAGAPALDFSTNKTNAAAPIAIESDLASNGSRQPKSPPLKATRAAGFINTTMPRPVFSQASAGAASHGAPSSSAPIAALDKSTRKVLPGHVTGAEDKSGQLRASRQDISDRVAFEAKVGARKTQEEAMAVARANDDQVSDKKLPKVSTSLEGRGTTRPIGKARMNDLRSMWEQ